MIKTFYWEEFPLQKLPTLSPCGEPHIRAFSFLLSYSTACIVLINAVWMGFDLHNGSNGHFALQRLTTQSSLFYMRRVLLLRTNKHACPFLCAHLNSCLWCPLRQRNNNQSLAFSLKVSSLLLTAWDASWWQKYACLSWSGASCRCISHDNSWGQTHMPAMLPVATLERENICLFPPMSVFPKAAYHDKSCLDIKMIKPASRLVYALSFFLLPVL